MLLNLVALLTPAITTQENYYRQLGLRDRILNLPLMVAAVLTLLWRDVAGVTELARMLAREGFLWCSPKTVSQQALSQRFLTFPACLFEKVFKNLLPHLTAAWHTRKSRPIPESVQFTLSKFERVWIVDCSTLEALFRKLGSLEDVPTGQLAGKMGTVIDLMTRLPVEIWFQSNPRASDTKFEEDILKLVTAKTLLLLDRGFYHFNFWLKLIERKVAFITRLKKGASLQIEQVFTDSYALRDFYGTSGVWHCQDSLHYLTSDRSSFRKDLALLFNEGQATDPVQYFAARENQDLGIVKQQRKPNVRLIIAPFPEQQRGSDQFFFQPLLNSP